MLERSHSSDEVQRLLEESRRINVEMIAAGMGAAIDDPATRIALFGWTGYIERALLVWLETREIPIEDLVTQLVAPLTGVLPFFPSDFNRPK
jgi:hypothetical protein